QHHARTSSVVRDAGNTGGKLLKHSEPESLGVTRKRAHGGIGEKLRELIRLILWNELDEIASGQAQICQYLSIFHERAEKKEARVRHRCSHEANNFAPILRAFARAPHPNEADFLFR